MVNSESHIDKLETQMQPVQWPNQSTVNKLTGKITISFLSKGNKLTLQKIQLQEEVEQKNDIEELKGIAPNLLSMINGLIENYHGENPNFTTNTKENEYLSKVDSIIYENLANSKFSINHVCQEMGCSRSQIYRAIRAITGKSVVGYINFCRLTKALELIKLNKYIIKEIAFMVGYNDNHYFSRVFKKEFGWAPSFYQPK